MNANELAERLDDMEPYLLDDLPILEAAADMLIKQQAEIEALKAEYAELFGKYQNVLLDLKFGKVQDK